jgi:hypothetical protein
LAQDDGAESVLDARFPERSHPGKFFRKTGAFFPDRKFLLGRARA